MTRGRGAVARAVPAIRHHTPLATLRTMTDVDALVERSGELKREMLDFAQHPRFNRYLGQELRRRFGEEVVGDEGELEDFFDWFIQQWRRPDGRTIAELFVDARPDLPPAEREFVLGWRDVVEGIFEVTGRDDVSLRTVGLVDDLTYRVRANVGPSFFEHFPDGSFLITRLVPCEDEWLISGPVRPAGPEDAEHMLRAAARLARTRPDLAFRNPERLARGWELQREDREAFVEHFGADVVIIPADELPGRVAELEAVAGPRLAAMSRHAVDDLERMGPTTATVGLIFDEHDGLGVYGDLGLVQEAFGAPELARRTPYRRILKTYLTDDDLSPVPLVRMAERDTDRADQVFRLVTGRPGFRWTRDGEALLRKHKPWAYDQPPQPRTVVLGDRIAPYAAEG